MTTHPNVSLCNQDAVEFLQDLKDNSVDLVTTDPAYESLEKHRAIGTTTRLKQDWFDIFPNSRFPELFQELYRVLKPNSHLYVMCDQETMFEIKPMGEAAGFKFWKPIVWDKVSIGMGYHYRCRYEFILFFEKGKRKLNNLGTPDVLAVNRVRGGYPTEKPVELMEVLVAQSSQPGQLVVDPFMGAGSVGVAAYKLGRHFIGNDLSPKARETAFARMMGVQPTEET